jgi:transposase
MSQYSLATQRGNTVEEQLFAVLTWIGAWSLAGVQAVTAKFDISPDSALYLLELASDRKLLEVKRLPSEDHVYVLSEVGAQMVAVESQFRLTRRNMVYLSRRALLAGLLADAEVVTPRELAGNVPRVPVDCGGMTRDWEPDLLMRPVTDQGRLDAVVLITHHQSRRTTESMCRAWHSNGQVAHVIFYTLPDILPDFLQLIDSAGLSGKLAALTLPLPEYAATAARNALKAQSTADRRPRLTQARHELRKGLAEASPSFCELTDAEWEVVDPVLAPERPHRSAPWNGLVVNHDRDVLNTILLAEHLGRNPFQFTPADGYASGAACAKRLAQWHRAGVWTQAYDRLAAVSAEQRQKLESAVTHARRRSRRNTP